MHAGSNMCTFPYPSYLLAYLLSLTVSNILESKRNQMLAVSLKLVALSLRSLQHFVFLFQQIVLKGLVHGVTTYLGWMVHSNSMAT